MKGNHLTRQIKIRATENETRKLEDFIELICDEYHIYDAYYGNILASNTIAFELLEEFTRKGEGPEIDIFFNSSPTGLFFTMKVNELFLEFASLYERTCRLLDEDADPVAENEKQMMMIKLLSDEIKIDPEDGSFTLVFHVTGINEPLSIQRIELLERYYSNLLQKEKAR